MNAATSLESLQLARDAGAEPARSAAVESAPGRILTAPLVAALTAFWIYVAVSNVLYARSMSLAFDPGGARHLFAPWDARLLQHVFLYPLLLGCVWGSLRLGWKPVWRAVPVQLLLAFVFAAAADPLLACAEMISMSHAQVTAAHQGADVSMAWGFFDPSDRSIWIASATSFLLAYGFALALVTGLALFRRIKDSELRLAALERAWSGARLAALRMQLSPHTLFNLLHTIRGQIAWDPPAAQQMVVQLGDLLRRLLTAGERDFTPLADEIEFARLYLELQRQRFADRLSLELPGGGTSPGTWVPSLILQPLVENAVAHGLADHTGPVVIRIECESTADRLRLRVINTIAPEDVRAGARRSRSAQEGGGVGLRNVRERLAVHFGERAAFEAGPARRAGMAAAEWTAEIGMPRLTEP